jgi:hypothetical protein
MQFLMLFQNMISKIRKKNENGQTMEIRESEQKSPQMGRYFLTKINKNWFLGEIHMIFGISIENYI